MILIDFENKAIQYDQPLAELIRFIIDHDVNITVDWKVRRKRKVRR